MTSLPLFPLSLGGFDFLHAPGAVGAVFSPVGLLKMEISQTAKLLYSLLLDRSTLSQKNKWLDDEGRIYIIYPIAEIAEILDKGSTTIKGALNVAYCHALKRRFRGKRINVSRTL